MKEKTIIKQRITIEFLIWKTFVKCPVFGYALLLSIKSHFKISNGFWNSFIEVSIPILKNTHRHTPRRRRCTDTTADTHIHQADRFGASDPQLYEPLLNTQITLIWDKQQPIIVTSVVPFKTAFLFQKKKNFSLPFSILSFSYLPVKKNCCLGKKKTYIWLTR